MCGITGIINHDQAHQLIRPMTDELSHRGPDASGYFCREDVALGHRRLSIIDLSEEANQPFTDASGRYQLVYNGEIYNYQDIKLELIDYPFQTQSDTEVLLASFLKWGINCLDKFNGMFAFAIWDAHTQELWLARDRLGIKPLYYYYNGGTLIFASEIRALLASGLVPKQIDNEGLVDYLTYGTTHAPKTIVQNVHIIPSGHYAHFQSGQLSIQSYWDISKPSTIYHEENPQKVRKHIYELLSKAVEKRMISDVPLGAFLSGGIDSSAIVALMAQASHDSINTFSVVFDEKAFDESPYSQLIAQKFNTHHTPILLKPEDFLQKLPEALDAMDSPSGDGINSYVVSQVTKKAGITVALSGLGGDELFAGYPVFTQWMKLQKFKHLWSLPLSLRRVLSNILRHSISSHKSDRLTRLINLPSLTLHEGYPVFRRLMDDYQLADIQSHSPANYNAIQNILQPLSQHLSYLPHLSQISIGEILSYTQNILLKDTDQMSMAHALEVRVPFFDHKLVEYTLQISDSEKYPHYSKQLLVESLGDLLPSDIVHRPKMGFVFPWKNWLKNELRSFSQQKINQLKKRNILNPDSLEHLFNSFLANEKNNLWLNIWLLIVLETWLENNHF